MKAINAKLGGEENGGVFYAPHQPVRDGAMTTALILDILAKTGGKFSDLLADLPLYYIEKDRLKCPPELRAEVLSEFVEKMKEVNIDTTDGVKMWFPDKSSILIRLSGTEPVFRFYSEGKTKERAIQLVKEHKEKLREIVNRIKT
jgi:phosphomannomutase/phosphoglucomutase